MITAALTKILHAFVPSHITFTLEYAVLSGQPILSSFSSPPLYPETLIVADFQNPLQLCIQLSSGFPTGKHKNNETGEQRDRCYPNQAFFIRHHRPRQAEPRACSDNLDVWLTWLLFRGSQAGKSTTLMDESCARELRLEAFPKSSRVSEPSTAILVPFAASLTDEWRKETWPGHTAPHILRIHFSDYMLTQ
nr:hypothetical protein CFP56_12268 [Quercus suber]